MLSCPCKLQPVMTFMEWFPLLMEEAVKQVGQPLTATKCRISTG